MQTLITQWRWFWWQHPIWWSITIVGFVVAQAFVWNQDGLQRASTIASLLLLEGCALAGYLTGLTRFTYGGDLNLAARDSAVPKLMRTLPGTDYRLAWPAIIAMAGWTCLLWLPTALAVNHLKPPEPLSLWRPLLGIIAFGWFLQAICWRPVHYPAGRIFALGVLAASALFSLPVIATLLTPLQGTLVLSCVVIVALMAALTSFSAGRHGRKRWSRLSARHDREIADHRSMTSVISASQTSLAPRSFSTPWRALMWRDLSQLGRLIPGLGLLMLTFFSWLAWRAGTNLAIGVTPWIAMLYVAPVLSGREHYWRGKSGLSAFIGGLPVTTKQLFLARLAVNLLLILFVWVVAWIPLVIWMLRDVHRLQFQQLLAWLETIHGEGPASGMVAGVFLASLLMGISVHLTMLPWTLYGRMWSEIFASVGVGIALFLLVFIPTQEFYNRLDVFSDAEKTAAYFANLQGMALTALTWGCAGKLGLFLLTLAFTHRVQVWTWSMLATVATIWAMVVLGGTAVARGLMPETLVTTATLIQALAMLVPLGSLPWGLAALDLNRHRH